MVEVVPIAITSVDWQGYLSNAHRMLGESVASTIDQYKMPKNLSAYIVTLTEFEEQRSLTIDPLKAVREAGALLRHISATFLVKGPNHVFSQLRERTDLKITSIDVEDPLERVGIVSGDLHQWQTAIVDLSVDRYGYNVRHFSNLVMACFEVAGLSQLWNKCSKTNMPDKTFKLEWKQ